MAGSSQEAQQKLVELDLLSQENDEFAAKTDYKEEARLYRLRNPNDPGETGTDVRYILCKNIGSHGLAPIFVASSSQDLRLAVLVESMRINHQLGSLTNNDLDNMVVRLG